MNIEFSIFGNQSPADALKLAYTGKPCSRPVKVTIRDVSAVPRSFTPNRTRACLAGLEWPSKRLDVNQLCKSLTGLAYETDKQVAMIDAAKIYGEPARVDVRVEELCY